MNKRLIVKNYKNKIIGSESLFNELYDLEGYPRCIITNTMILYNNTDPRISRENSLTFKGTSPLTYKEINGEKYYLKVSYKGMIKEFGEEYSSKNIGRVFNQLNKFTKFAFQIPDNEFNKAKELGFSTPVTLKSMIKRYGKENGTEKFNSYCNKQSHTNTFEYKKEKFNWSEEEFREFNLSRAVTLENLIKKYGEKQGKIKYEVYCHKQSITSTNDYLLEKFGEEKYFEILDAKYRKRDFFVKKYGKLEGIIKYKEYWNKRNSISISNEANDFISFLFTELNVSTDLIHEDELRLYDPVHNKFYLYDVTFTDIKLIIEFNGDLWHGNPKLYESTDTPLSGFKNFTTAQELWEYDLIKKNLAEENGYNVIYVWSSDFKHNPGNEIDKIKKVWKSLKK